MVREKELNFATRKKKPTFIRLVLGAGEALSVAPLSATLGQVQINSMEFCKDFNALSLERFEQGTLVNVRLFKAESGYYFEISSIFLPFLLFQIADSHKQIPLELLYDVYRLKRSTHLKSNAHFSFQSAKEFFGGLRASKFQIIFLF